MSSSTAYITTTIATATSLPIPLMPFEPIPYFKLSSSYGYAVISCISFATTIYFIYYVYSVEYKEKKSWKKCCSSFNILLTIMFLSLTIWPAMHLFAGAIPLFLVAYVYDYYEVLQTDITFVGSIGICMFRAAYLTCCWLRSKTMVTFSTKYSNFIQFFMLYILPLVIFLPLGYQVFYVTETYALYNDPSYNSYYESFNANTGSNDESLLSANALSVMNTLINSTKLYININQIVQIVCTLIDIFLIAIFVKAISRSQKVLSNVDPKFIEISRYGLASSSTMLVACIVSIVRTYDTKMFGVANMWLDIVIVVLMYVTALLLLVMKFTMAKQNGLAVTVSVKQPKESVKSRE